MLIDLHDDVGDGLAELTARPAAVDALRCLALAHHEGKHFVTGNRGVLDALGRCRALGDASQAMYRHASRRLSDGHQLRARLRARIVVRATLEPGAPRVSEHPDKLVFTAPIADFVDSSRIQASRVLGENLDDAKIYCAAAAAYLHRFGARDLVAHLRAHGGGGGTTAELFEAHSSETPVLCIVDSDRKSAMAALGTTARAVQQARARIHRRPTFVAADARVLGCHELENLIPAGLAIAALDGVPETRRWIAHAEEAGCLGRADFVDLKRWLADRAGQSNPIDFLSHVAVHVDRLSANKLAESLFTAPLTDHWEDLGAHLLAWGCAPKRKHVL